MWKCFMHYTGLEDCAEHLGSACTPGLGTPSGAAGAEDRQEPVSQRSALLLWPGISLQRAGPWTGTNAEPDTGMPGGTVAFQQLYGALGNHLALMPGFQDAREVSSRQSISRTESSTWTLAALMYRSRHMPRADSMILRQSLWFKVGAEICGVYKHI